MLTTQPFVVAVAAAVLLGWAASSLVLVGVAAQPASAAVDRPAGSRDSLGGLPTRFCVTDAALAVADTLDGVADGYGRTALYRRVLRAIRCVDARLHDGQLNDNQFGALVLVAANATGGCAAFNDSAAAGELLRGGLRPDQVLDTFLRLVPGERGLASAKLYGAVDVSPCADWSQRIGALRVAEHDAATRALPILSVIATEQRLRHEQRSRAAAALAARQRVASGAGAGARARQRQYAMLNAAGAVMDASKVKATASSAAHAVARAKANVVAQAQVELQAKATAKGGSKGQDQAQGQALGKTEARAAANARQAVAGTSHATLSARVVAAAASGAATMVAAADRARVQTRSAAAAATATKDGGDLWWMEQEPWFLPPPDEWGPLPATMATHYWHKPRFHNDRYTSYNPPLNRDGRPDLYDRQLPVRDRPRATLTRQLEYERYVDDLESHLHYNPTGDRNRPASSNLQYANSAYFGAGGLNEGHARQLDAKDAPNNYAPLFARAPDFYFHHNWNAPPPVGVYNGGINSFLQTGESVVRHRRDGSSSSSPSSSTTHFHASPRVMYRRRTSAEQPRAKRVALRGH